MGEATRTRQTQSQMRRFAQEFWWFGLKQAWACIFGGLLLAGFLATRWWYPDVGLHRFDFLFLYAVGIQIALLAFKLESIRECGVIVLFHLLATAMELFKTSDAIGSWSYPGDGAIKLGNVPLFAGFMYSAVGSYIARAWRVFDLRFTRFPPIWIAAALAAASYVNFFTHHYIFDIRWMLIIAIALAYCRTFVLYRPLDVDRRMPLLLSFVLLALFIWIAENVSTFAGTWIYPSQRDGWQVVSASKLIAWFLLMQLSFVLVYLLRVIEAKLSVGRGAPRPAQVATLHESDS